MQLQEPVELKLNRNYTESDHNYMHRQLGKLVVQDMSSELRLEIFPRIPPMQKIPGKNFVLVLASKLDNKDLSTDQFNEFHFCTCFKYESLQLTESLYSFEIDFEQVFLNEIVESSFLIFRFLGKIGS